MNHAPIYVSRRTAKSLWQQYRIYPDRLELQSWFLLHTVILPANELLDVEVRPSGFGGFKGMTWGIKLDNSDLCRHVSIRKRSGLFKRMSFSPDDPEKFAALCKSIIPNG